jgi:hypothetical protein
MLTFSIINSINEVDFDSLFEDSLNNMNTGTYIWTENVDTVEKKKQHLRDIINSLVDPFMYKVMDESGKDLSLVIGSLNKGTFTIILSFTGYNNNMSKSWIYYTETIEARRAFFEQQQISSVQFNHLSSSGFSRKAPILLGSGWESRTYPTDKKFSPTMTVDFFKSNIVSE